MTVAARLDDLAVRFALPAQAVAALQRLLDVLATDATAPTAIRDPAVAVDAHLADALVALELDLVRDARSIADLGSGAGFPGLALAAALPDAQVALVESIARKCDFIQRAAAQMRLSNVEVIPTRAETWPAGIGQHDLVTARAVAPLSVLVEYAAPLLGTGGAFVAWKARCERGEERDADAAAAATGMEFAHKRRVEPWRGAEHLHLHVYLKVGLTPNRFPRRPGMASKRPIRASS